jgi:DNA invertase Pin-like site-specific DNA recombinase
VVVTYKIDRLTRSLADFAKIAEIFDARGVSFVSVTQQFNTTTSMGRLTLNVLLSFAQFEREVTGERIRDKIAASKKKGMWMGGNACGIRRQLQCCARHFRAQMQQRWCSGNRLAKLGGDGQNESDSAVEIDEAYRRWCSIYLATKSWPIMRRPGRWIGEAYRDRL